MAGVGRGRIITFMAGKTVGRCIVIISVGVTCCTVVNGVALGERKKGVVDVGSCPGDPVDAVAFNTIGRKPAFLVIGIGGGQVVGPVTIVTFNAQGFKFEGGCGWMALVAIGRGVRP